LLGDALKLSRSDTASLRVSVYTAARGECNSRMPSLSATQLLFLVYNAATGLLIGALSARIPAFAGLGIPTFAWLVLAMLAFEMLAGLVLKAHPSTIIAMPLRLAGLMASFACCYAILAVLNGL
jgi:hypothetical protein